MSNLRALIDHYDNQSPLKSLSLEESKALFDLLLLAVMIDGEVTDEELESVSQESEKFPFADAAHFEELVGAHAHQTRDELESILDDEAAVDKFIEDRAAVITDDEKRRKSLEMIAVVAYSDGVDQSEEDLCHQIGAHFGFSKDEIESKLVVGSLEKMG